MADGGLKWVKAKTKRERGSHGLLFLDFTAGSFFQWIRLNHPQE